MDTTKLIIGGVSFAIAYALYTFFVRKKDNSFDKEYDEVLNSAEYKVKGQYDR